MGDVSGQTGCLPGTRGIARRRPRYAAVDARAPCDKGFGGWRRSRSPLRCTAFRLGGGAGCPQSCSRAHHSIAQGFEWRGSRDVHTVIGMRHAPVPTLTVEIHSAASGFRRWISTPEIAHDADPAFTLTDRIHRGATGFVGRCLARTGRPEPACGTIAGSRSPLQYTGLRVAAMTVIHVRSGRTAHHAGTLTVENHSASSDPPRGISTWARIRRATAGAPRKTPSAGIPSRKELIGRASADAHRRSASSNRERRISTWTRIRRAMAEGLEAPPRRRHSVPEAAHRPVER